MPVEFIGANPCATLMRAEARAGFVSLWEAEWSVHGPGLAVLAWVEGDDTVRLLTPDSTLGGWLADTFSRWFPELDGLPGIGDPVDCDVTEWHIDAGHARAKVTGADGTRLAATISRPVETRPGQAIARQLGGVPWTCTNLLTFCTDATLEVDGARVLGRPEANGTAGRAHSTAVIATHETWTRHPPPPDAATPAPRPRPAPE